MAALKKLRRKAEALVAEGRSLLIFPQGTRVASGQSVPYQVGVFALYQATSLHVVPVALNSGRFWARNGFIKKPGVVLVHFLPTIGQGLPRDSVMTKIDYELETAMLSLDGLEKFEIRRFSEVGSGKDSV